MEIAPQHFRRIEPGGYRLFAHMHERVDYHADAADKGADGGCPDGASTFEGCLIVASVVPISLERGLRRLPTA